MYLKAKVKSKDTISFMNWMIYLK